VRQGAFTADLAQQLLRFTVRVEFRKPPHLLIRAEFHNALGSRL